jgi:hypothetical protein
VGAADDESPPSVLHGLLGGSRYRSSGSDWAPLTAAKCRPLNVPPLSSGRTSKTVGYTGGDEREHGAGENEARPSASNSLLGGSLNHT